MLTFRKYFTVLPLVCIAIIAGCSLEKKSYVNRKLQNLTAHYNILFNANELLQLKQDSYAASFVDAYDRILSIYQDTTLHTTVDKELDAVVAKANTIITIKEQSHYLGDAYLLLGKAAFLRGDFFNAVEYFSYVTRSFLTQTDLAQQARAWQIRAHLYLNQPAEAKQVIDSAMAALKPKSKFGADVYGAATQFYIDQGNFTEAASALQNAIAQSSQKQQRLRWMFILAQLQELNGQQSDAYNNYNRVVKSNAPFELAFNAQLNRIRITDSQNGAQLSRADQLKRLLRNPNNADFTDQIYYQLAELELSNKNTDKAVDYYRQSVKASLKNTTQKGMSFLRLADISFKNYGNYTIARQYYDSTLLNLPSGYPGYIAIRTKAENLQLLADSYRTIAHEDSLQALAKLGEQERALQIEQMVNNYAKQPTAAATTANTTALAGQAASPIANNTPPGDGTASGFYFDNTAAISQGFIDFKRRWGNRKLEDNWRRSTRNNSDITLNTQNTTQNIDPTVVPGTFQKTTADVAASGYRQNLLQNLPLTPELLAQSNGRIYNAYLDLANFYRDVLNDKPAAIDIYETLARRFPDDSNIASIYYNLYRLYSNTPAKADEYKNILLSKYPQTPFAKVLLDPDFARHMDDKDAELNAFYNQVYDLYTERHYAEVITRADELLKQYANAGLAPQLAYLRALALGHQQKIQPFKAELLQIATTYPADVLITPLVRQHLIYIDANINELQTRKFAIVDSDPNSMAFLEQPVAAAPAQASKPVQIAQAKPAAPPAVQTKPAAAASTKPVVASKPAETTPVTTKPPVVAANKNVVSPPSLFSNRDSTNYYFVIKVSSGSTNLSSSRFGVGQFNRTSYQGSDIRHQLEPVGDNNQLIYIGRFYRLEDVKEYARKIVPLLPQIMKVPADKYSFFIITQENLDKLADEKKLDSYIEYYQKSF